MAVCGSATPPKVNEGTSGLRLIVRKIKRKQNEIKDVNDILIIAASLSFDLAQLV